MYLTAMQFRAGEFFSAVLIFLQRSRTQLCTGIARIPIGRTAKLAMLFLAVACSPDDRSQGNRSQIAGSLSSSASAIAGAFSDHYQLVGILTPEQSPANPIVRVSGIDFAPDGRFLIGDASERNVKLFASDGTLLRVIGRSGQGPGEFISPRNPRFGPDGRIHVADAQTARVQVFTPEGDLEKLVTNPDILRIDGFEIRPDHGYVVLVPSDLYAEVLIQTDWEGVVTSRALPIGRVLPEGGTDHPAWSSLRSFGLDLRNDTAFVSSSVSDSIWVVALGDESVSATQMRFDEYVRPDFPYDSPPTNTRELIDWASSVHMAATLSVEDVGLFLPYVQGVLIYGDPMILLNRNAVGEWYALSGAPPIIGASGSQVIAIQDPDADEISFAIFQRR